MIPNVEMNVLDVPVRVPLRNELLSALFAGVVHALEVGVQLGGRFNSIKKGTKKRPEKGTESPFAKNICMNSLYWVE